jgi:hypothetical protein
MKKSEKDIHEARAEAKRAEEAAEREKHIGIVSQHLTLAFVFVTSNWLIFSSAAELLLHWSRSTLWSTQKKMKAIEIINMAESIVDEVVNKLLNEVAEKVLKEE